jgi:class 3 adenylate cyclase
MVKEGIRSSLTCPLISAGKAIGFIFFSSRTAGTYERVHVEIFKLIAGHLSLVVEKSNMYQQILREKDNSESLLLNVIPARIAARLRAGEQPIVDSLPSINILFADIAGFTEVASRFPPERVLHVLQDIFLLLDDLCDRHDVEKIKTIGDEYLAISGTSSAAPAELRKLAEFALDALASIRSLRWPDGESVRIRIGMHCGPVVAGVIGQKKFAYDIWGDAVNTASRMESSGEVGRIQVTQEVRSRLLDNFEFEERGPIDVKGKGTMTTYFLTGKK